MRKLLLGLMIIGLAAPADAASRNFGVSGFTKIRVDGPYRVRLTTNVAPFARASGPAAALDRLAIDVRGDTLVVHSNVSSWGADTGAGGGPVDVALGTHELSNAWLNGAGELSIDAVKGLAFALSVQGSGSAIIGQSRADQLNVSVVGTGSARVGGQARKLTGIVRGIASLDAAALQTRDATLAVEGAASIAATVSNAVTVDASGPATVRLSGRPACTVRATGSAAVSGCR